MAGISSKLKVAMERCYNEHVMDTAAQEKKKASPEKPGLKPSPAPKQSGSKTLGHREKIKLHIKKPVQGPGWTYVPPKDFGPNVRRPYQLSRHQDDAGASQAGCSSFTNKLLSSEENMTDFLNYEDDEQEDLEIAQAVAHILKSMDDADVEMEEENPAPGFEPEVGCSGYDVNLV